MSDSAESQKLGLKSDGIYSYTGEELETLLTEVAGSASGVFLREDPTKVMPAEAIVIALTEFVEASADSLVPLPDDKVRLVVSIEGAKSFCAEGAPGWGAIGLQEITEGLEGQLAARGIFPPFRPEP